MGTWADWPPPGPLLDACKFHAGDAWAASVLRRIASRTPGKPLLPAIADEVVGIVAAAICCSIVVWLISRRPRVCAGRLEKFFPRSPRRCETQAAAGRH